MLKKILVIFLCFFLIFLIYKFTYTNKLDYLALGDGLALGQTHYGTAGYGYTDYIADYLKQKKSLKSYSKTFAKDQLSIKELTNNIKNNKKEIKDGNILYINNAIAEAEIITISIGNHEMSDINKYINNEEEAFQKVNIILKNIRELIDLVKKYNPNGNIYLIGYYSYGHENSKNLIKYTDKKLQKISEAKKIKFIKISDIFENNIKYLPNTMANYPSNLGYKEISRRVINKMIL